MPDADYITEYDSACRGYLIQADSGGIVAYDDENGCSLRNPIRKLFLPVRTIKFIRNIKTLSNCSITVEGEPPYQKETGENVDA